MNKKDAKTFEGTFINNQKQTHQYNNITNNNEKDNNKQMKDVNGNIIKFNDNNLKNEIKENSNNIDEIKIKSINQYLL